MAIFSYENLFKVHTPIISLKSAITAIKESITMDSSMSSLLMPYSTILQMYFGGRE